MERSVAASPRMLFPLASTFTWKLVNTPNCEIIRGEVSIFRGGAGGLSYFSMCSAKGIMRTGASWAEVVVIAASETGRINAVTIEIVEDFIWQLTRLD